MIKLIDWLTNYKGVTYQWHFEAALDRGRGNSLQRRLTNRSNRLINETFILYYIYPFNGTLILLQTQLKRKSRYN